MAIEYVLNTGDKVTPEDKNGPRVGIGCHCMASRPTAGAIGIQILRGDGGDPVELFDYSVRSKWFGPVEANVEIKVELAALDQPMPDYTPRTYRMRVVADGEDVSARAGFIATEPYTPAGIDP
jgi:hypothetical protein